MYLQLVMFSYVFYPVFILSVHHPTATYSIVSFLQNHCTDIYNGSKPAFPLVSMYWQSRCFYLIFELADVPLIIELKNTDHRLAEVSLASSPLTLFICKNLFVCKSFVKFLFCFTFLYLWLDINNNIIEYKYMYKYIYYCYLFIYIPLFWFFDKVNFMMEIRDLWILPLFHWAHILHSHGELVLDYWQQCSVFSVPFPATVRTCTWATQMQTEKWHKEWHSWT